MRKLLLLAMLVGVFMALTVSSALAAQGQITEVNPSGIGISNASDRSGGKSDQALIKAGAYTDTSKSLGGTTDPDP